MSVRWPVSLRTASSTVRLYVGTHSCAPFDARWMVVMVQSLKSFICCESVSQNAEVWGCLVTLTKSFQLLCFSRFAAVTVLLFVLCWKWFKLCYDPWLWSLDFCSSLAPTAATWCTRTWWWQSASMISSHSASTSAGFVMERKHTECSAAPTCQVWIHLTAKLMSWHLKISTINTNILKSSALSQT